MEISEESFRKFAKLNEESTELYGNKQKRSWTVEEDAKLCQLAKVYGSVGKEAWQTIAEHFPGRSIVACRQHWAICTAPNYENKAINQHSKSVPTMSNHVLISSSNEWTDLENMLLLNAYLILGANWEKISHTVIPTRDPFQIQVQWLKNICPCIKKFFVNYYELSRYCNVNDSECNAVVDTSCPLYGISDIPFISQAISIRI